jgi:hypothetical protein
LAKKLKTSPEEGPKKTGKAGIKPLDVDKDFETPTKQETGRETRTRAFESRAAETSGSGR